VWLLSKLKWISLKLVNSFDSAVGKRTNCLRPANVLFRVIVNAHNVLTNLHVLFSFISWTCGRLSNLHSTTFSSQTVFGFELSFQKPACIIVPMWYLQGIQIWRASPWFLLNHLWMVHKQALLSNMCSVCRAQLFAESAAPSGSRQVIGKRL